MRVHRVQALLNRFDRLDNKSSAKLIGGLLLLSLVYDHLPSAVSEVSSTGIQCVCDGIDGTKYTLEASEAPSTSQRCGLESLDICECRDDRGNIVEIDIPKAEWLPNIDRLELDLNCSPLDYDTNEDEAKERPKREAAPTYVEKKTNILSRTIDGAGSIVGGLGDAVGSGVSGVGNVAGSVISGSFHLVGTATKKVTSLTGDTISTIGSIFEGKKTITKDDIKEDNDPIPDNSNDSKTDKRPLNRVTRSVKNEDKVSADKIKNNSDLKVYALSTEAIFKAFQQITDIFNKYEDVAAAKVAVQDLIENEPTKEIKEIYQTYYDLLAPGNLDHEVDEAEIISIAPLDKRITDEKDEKGFWHQVGDIKRVASESTDIYDMIDKIKHDEHSGDYSKAFAEFMSGKFSEAMSCSVIDDSFKVGAFMTIGDVATMLERRIKICGNPEHDSHIQPIIDAIHALPKPKGRIKRSAESKDPKTSRPKKSPAKKSKPKKKKVAHEPIHEHAETHDDNHEEDQHSEVSEEEHQEHVDDENHAAPKPTAKKGGHKKHPKPAPHHDDEEEDVEDDYEPSPTCRCDPDTGAALKAT